MNIEKPSFKRICLMHIQALTNFPYIEKDFDAITDYELICKVVDYLNQVIANSNKQNTTIINLYNAFVELKDYVDNYFENLDVQEEINNKLDEMVEDGTIETMLQEIVNYEINVKIAGAKGDGTTDDTEIIQSLINENKPLYFPEGTYLVSELTCNGYVNIRGDGKNLTTIKAKGESAIDYIFNAYDNTNGFNIKDLKIDGNNIAKKGIIASKRSTGYTSTRRNTIENISIINCTELGAYIGGVSTTVNNINVVLCYAGVHMETYGAILTNSIISQCEDYGLKLSNGNGYVTNNKIYLNKNGIICDGLCYSVCNNNIQQNTENGIILTEDSNSNVFNENILLANGYYENELPTNNYEIIINGYNNRITGTFIPYTSSWNSKRKAIINNIYGFNNYVEITESRSLEMDNSLNRINYVNSYDYVDGNNIGNFIKINTLNMIPTTTKVTSFSSHSTTGTHIEDAIDDGTQTLTLSNVTLSKWGAGSITGLEGGMVRIIPTTTTGIKELYVTFDVSLSIQYDKVGIGHYLSYVPTGGSLTPVESVANVRTSFNPLTNKHKVMLYALLDNETDISYFQINSRFLSYNNNDTTINEIVATIDNVEYFIK